MQMNKNRIIKILTDIQTIILMKEMQHTILAKTSFRGAQSYPEAKD